MNLSEMKSIGWRILRSKQLYGSMAFAGYGVFNEIVFTGVAAWTGQSFRGAVSLLMVPVYVVSYLIIVSGVYRRLSAFFPNLFLRSLWIVLIVYAVEYLAGTLYFGMGLEPWRYHHGWASDFSGGAITLYYAPFWYVFAFIVVRVGAMIDQLSPVIERLFFQEGNSFWEEFSRSAAEIGSAIEAMEKRG